MMSAFVRETVVRFHSPDHFGVCPDDVALEIQQVVMVVETGQSVQPQQGHAELSSHFFQFTSADVKTLKRERTFSLETPTRSEEEVQLWHNETETSP